MESKVFPNGFTSWMETHYEVASFITLQIEKYNSSEADHNIIYKRQLEQGHGGLYELSEEWTDEFELKFKGEEWGIEREYFDEIESFLDNKLKQQA